MTDPCASYASDLRMYDNCMCYNRVQGILNDFSSYRQSREQFEQAYQQYQAAFHAYTDAENAQLNARASMNDAQYQQWVSQHPLPTLPVEPTRAPVQIGAEEGVLCCSQHVDITTKAPLQTADDQQAYLSKCQLLLSTVTPDPSLLPSGTTSSPTSSSFPSSTSPTSLPSSSTSSTAMSVVETNWPYVALGVAVVILLIILLRRVFSPSSPSSAPGPTTGSTA